MFQGLSAMEDIEKQWDTKAIFSIQLEESLCKKNQQLYGNVTLLCAYERRVF
jgi:hypothetical protein